MTDDTETPKPTDPGPMDGFATRELLDARVARSYEGRVEVHGLDVADDLSRHYSFAEAVLTSVLGDPPDEATGALFELCCHFAAPVSVAEAPAHVARITEIIATAAAGSVAATSVALAEQAQFQLERLADFWAWLDEPAGGPPGVALADDESLPGLAEAFAERVEELPVDVPGMRSDLAFWPMLLACLHACGIRSERAVVTVLVTARLPIAAAEGQFGEAGKLDDYPLNIPRVEYLHEEARNARDPDTRDDRG